MLRYMVFVTVLVIALRRTEIMKTVGMVCWTPRHAELGIFLQRIRRPVRAHLTL